jgi:hypothetical protein
MVPGTGRCARWKKKTEWPGRPRGAGLEPADGESEFLQLVGEADGRQVSRPASRIMGEANVDQATHESAGGQNDRPAGKADTRPGVDAKDDPVLDMKAGHLGLLQVKVHLTLQDMLHPEAILLLVGLGPGGAHRRSLPHVENAELDAGGVDVLAHLPPQGIDLLDQVPLGQSSDGRITRHQRYGIQVDGQEECGAPHPGGGKGRLAAGMPGPHHDDVVCPVIVDQLSTPAHIQTAMTFSRSGTTCPIVRIPPSPCQSARGGTVSRPHVRDTVSQLQTRAGRPSSSIVPRGTIVIFQYRTG